MHYHPRLNEHGQKHPIHKPHAPSAPETWEDAGAVATAVPDGAMPHALCGLAIDHAEAPQERAGWEALAGRDDFDEPEFVVPKGWKTTAGAVVIEPDGRVWLVSPTNGFAGYVNTFPKGSVSGGLSLRATALKELYEEAGLLAELTGFLVDADRTNSRCRYYLARRIGGNPADMGWESQAVHLVPPPKLAGMASHAKDAPVVAALLRHLETRREERPEQTGPRAATARDWPDLMPMTHTPERWPLEWRFSARQYVNLRLGLIPEAQEQKWFAYFDGDALNVYRSWTGFFMFRVHLRATPEGAIATHAEANLDPEFYSGTADEARDTLEDLVQYLASDGAHVPYEDPMVAALKRAAQPNYLGSPDVVSQVIHPLFVNQVDNWRRLHGDAGATTSWEDCQAVAQRIWRIMNGQEPGYTTLPGWHSREQLGEALVRCFNLDPDYCADESLELVLSESTGAVGLRIKHLLDAWHADEDGDWGTVLGALQNLKNFVVAVFLGTHTVVAPGMTLADFNWVGAPEAHDDERVAQSRRS